MGELLNKDQLAVNIQGLSEIVHKINNQEFLTYHDLSQIQEQGLYVVFNQGEVLYVGKTTRYGKIRMQELVSDFRSHTLNKKLLSKRFKELGLEFITLRKEHKKTWIDAGIITLECFKAEQKLVNDFLRRCAFKFCPVMDDAELTFLEHFAIAVLRPGYND